MAPPKATPAYLKNLELLAEYTLKVAKSVSNIGSMEALGKDFELVLGKGTINPSQLGRYKNKVQSSESLPRTHLSFAKYLHIKTSDSLNREFPRWGNDFEEALTLVYDWLAYGPDGPGENPRPDRHRHRPTVEQIEAKQSDKVDSVTAMAPAMNTFELLESMEALLGQLSYRLNSAADPAPVAAPTPETVCEDDKPIPNLIYRAGLLQARPETKAGREAAIHQLADKTGLSLDRARAVLCGQPIESDEIGPLSELVLMSAEAFTDIASTMGAILPPLKA
jgi:hypothetical protein